MDYIEILPQGDGTLVKGVQNFCPEDIFGCGQCFRWENTAPETWTGVAFGRVCVLEQRQEDLYFPRTPPKEFHSIWYEYFDFGRDYSRVKRLLSQDESAARAVSFCPGMRVLRQDPWEALCSFILSQNNNIKRIRGIVERLCQRYGTPLGEGLYGFPAPEILSGLEAEDLEPVRCGFRARYILHAARLVASGSIRLESLRSAPLSQAREELRQITGVGPKVAECALLYGLGRVECVPVDVWISRVLDQLYPGGFPEFLEEIGGIAQQYLFHYARRCPEFSR